MRNFFCMRETLHINTDVVCTQSQPCICEGCSSLEETAKTAGGSLEYVGSTCLRSLCKLEGESKRTRKPIKYSGATHQGSHRARTLCSLLQHRHISFRICFLFETVCLYCCFFVFALISRLNAVLFNELYFLGTQDLDHHLKVSKAQIILHKKA